MQKHNLIDLFQAQSEDHKIRVTQARAQSLAKQQKILKKEQEKQVIHGNNEMQKVVRNQWIIQELHQFKD